MKKILYFLFIGIAMSAVLTSCKDAEDDIDVLRPAKIDESSTPPFTVTVKVVDLKGRSVLNNLLTPFITATFENLTYNCDEPAAKKLYSPNFHGLKRQDDYLQFGEFFGFYDFDKAELILNWDGYEKPDTITFSNLQVEENGKWRYKRTYWVNGEQVEGQIVLKKDLGKIMSEYGRDISLTNEQRERVQGLNTFGFKLFQQMMADVETPYGSTMASPMSVAYVLGMIADGAPLFDPTRTEILKAMGFEDKAATSELTEMDELFKKLIVNIPKVDFQSRITMANALFCRQEKPAAQQYIDHIANVYKADYSVLDFTSPEALKTINDWSAQKTKGVIPQILDAIDNQAIAYFLNAIYFSGNWMTPFDEANTKEEDFTHKDGSKQKVDMMHNKLMMGFNANDTYTAVTTTMTSLQKYTMTFLLPNEGKTVEDVIQSLIDKPVNSFPVTGTLVTLSLPRFTIEANHEKLIPELQKMGINRVFTDANMDVIWPEQRGLLVSRMKQKTSIKVNEKGCEAAAVTIAEMYATANGETQELLHEYTFTADRPFVFIIREGSSAANFFVGTYCGN